jgi:hypothetical protein
MRRFRFSLRFAFVVTTIVACVCYALVLPTLYAQRFVAAVGADDYELADNCFRDPNDRFLADWHQKFQRFQARASLEPWSLREFVRGKRLVRLHVASGNPGPLLFHTLVVPAAPAGLLSPQKVGGSGPGGGGFDVPLTPQVPTA